MGYVSLPEGSHFSISFCKYPPPWVDDDILLGGKRFPKPLCQTTTTVLTEIHLHDTHPG